ncbi:DNA ligase [Neisseria sp. S1]|uniref:DNA ligase n=1 Tax=Neisseria sp. S1 TaxID=3318354 RepID=UPI003A8BA63B
MVRYILPAYALAFICFPLGASPNLLLAQEFKGQNVQGWAMSEKLDGVRAYWDGKRLISRGGYSFSPPTGFTRYFPPYPLDGELYSGRGRFEQISATVRSAHADWHDIKLHVFDVPKAEGNLYQRLAVLQRWLDRNPKAPIVVIRQIPVRNNAHAQGYLKEVESLGGEGVMLRNPNLPYQGGRSSNLLKLKSAYDAECTVTRHHEGRGKYAGMLGALGCKNHLGEFRIGSGFKDADRQNPPPVGSLVTYRYRGFTKTGMPRFATYVRIRNDSPEKPRQMK